MLLVAPLSGHFATLLRGTVRTMLPEHDVYITDWHNARDVAARARPLRLRRLCRPPDPVPRGDRAGRACRRGLPALRRGAGRGRGDGAGASNPAQPRSMTLMAGPIDTRVNPTKVNELAKSKPIEWFEQNLIAAVPLRYRRRVPPRLSGLRAARRLHEHEHRAPHQGASRAVRQLGQRRGRQGPGDQGFLRRVFRRARPAGRVLSGDRAAGVPGASRCRAASSNGAAARSSRARSGAPRCSPSRASATTSARSARRWPRTICARACGPICKRHHLQPGVGHYGVFSGRRWKNQIYPLVKNVILASD